MVENPARLDRALPASVDVPLNRKAASLLFLHALTERPGQNYVRKAELAGFYFMVYEDDTFVPCDIKYNINVANWDGLPTRWGYSPRGKTMKRATLAWEGQTMAGPTAALYYTEWVNPRPDETIARVVLAAPHLKRAASPVLLALSGVSPTAADTPRGAQRLPLSVLEAPQPVGRPVGLVGGRILSAETYVAPDGTTVHTGTNILNRVNTIGCEAFWSATASLLFPNNQYPRFPTGFEPVDIVFPVPRPLSGVMVTPAFRQETSVNDFRGRARIYTIELSPDGFSWQALEKQTGHYPEIEGPRFVRFPEGQYKAVRVTGSFSHVQLYSH
jgi:hypothetical protein